ncbi:Hypothetical predicted protein [Mytilus galloprovincialis]|uniref:Uncharacterized protein n=1 Tax=Mytilus galloprovincialis TaxID=29158 RepID=A0A8B6H175_MYTGA|nr:Hypothetical predicted protein [Mytilus galloprovincialis]
MAVHITSDNKVLVGGDTAINKNRKFYPTDIVTTPRDNAIIADMTTSTLYILNNAGILMTYYQISDINITYPVALAFPPAGQLYIACSRPNDSTTKEVEIYEVTISEC